MSIAPSWLRIVTSSLDPPCLFTTSVSNRCIGMQHWLLVVNNKTHRLKNCHSFFVCLLSESSLILFLCSLTDFVISVMKYQSCGSVVSRKVLMSRLLQSNTCFLSSLTNLDIRVWILSFGSAAACVRLASVDACCTSIVCFNTDTCCSVCLPLVCRTPNAVESACKMSPPLLYMTVPYFCLQVYHM